MFWHAWLNSMPPVAVNTPVTPNVPLIVTPSEQFVVTMSMIPVLPDASNDKADALLSIRSISVAAPVRVIQPPPIVRSVTVGEADHAGIQDPPITNTVLAAPLPNRDNCDPDEAYIISPVA